MNIRRTVLATGLCLSLLTAGCASVVAGQAQIATGAVLPSTSQSAPAPFPDPSGDGSSTSGPPSTESTAGSSESSPGGDGTTGVTGNAPTGPSGSTGPSSESTGSSDGPTSVTSIPGLSKDCSTVLAGITAFSTILQSGGSASDTISQATVDKALEQLPESGLPARPQADMAVLRKVVSGAAGKTISELGLSMVDGKVVTALQDLSSWAQANC